MKMLTKLTITSVIVLIAALAMRWTVKYGDGVMAGSRVNIGNSPYVVSVNTPTPTPAVALKKANGVTQKPTTTQVIIITPKQTQYNYQQVTLPHNGKSYYCRTGDIPNLIKLSNMFIDSRNNILSQAKNLGVVISDKCAIYAYGNDTIEFEKCKQRVEGEINETGRKLDEILNGLEANVQKGIDYSCK